MATGLTQIQPFVNWTTPNGKPSFQLQNETDFGYLREGNFIQRLYVPKVPYLAPAPVKVVIVLVVFVAHGEWPLPGTTSNIEYRCGLLQGINAGTPHRTWLGQSNTNPANGRRREFR